MLCWFRRAKIWLLIVHDYLFFADQCTIISTSSSANQLSKYTHDTTGNIHYTGSIRLCLPPYKSPPKRQHHRQQHRHIQLNQKYAMTSSTKPESSPPSRPLRYRRPQPNKQHNSLTMTATGMRCMGGHGGGLRASVVAYFWLAIGCNVLTSVTAAAAMSSGKWMDI